MLKVVSYNVNGIRAAARKGFFDWLQTLDADVWCLQETKAQEHQLDDPQFQPEGYHCYYVDAQKKGYSGVALYAKREPDELITNLGWETADNEGRYIEAKFANLRIASLYLPSGSSGEERQAIKYDFMDHYDPILMKQRENNCEYILCGDWNIAHKKIDIKNWRGNQKNSGFLPEERAWLDQLFAERGYVDAFRQVNAEADQYTWWSNRGRARENNVGWRIDYQVISPGLAQHVVAADIYKEQWFSDHAPLIIEYDI